MGRQFINDDKDVLDIVYQSVVTAFAAAGLVWAGKVLYKDYRNRSKEIADPRLSPRQRRSLAESMHAHYENDINDPENMVKAGGAKMIQELMEHHGKEADRMGANAMKHGKNALPHDVLEKAEREDRREAEKRQADLEAGMGGLQMTATGKGKGRASVAPSVASGSGSASSGPTEWGRPYKLADGTIKRSRYGADGREEFQRQNSKGVWRSSSSGD